MPVFAKLLMTAGAVLLVAGAVLYLAGGKLGWLGRLPGDLRIGDSLYVPITSCIVVSLVLTLVLNLIGRFFR